MKSIDESAEDVTDAEILFSQARVFRKLQPHLIVYYASVFQKLEEVTDDPPSRGEHVRIVYPSRYFEGRLSETFNADGEIPTECQSRLSRNFCLLEGPEMYFPWTEERSRTLPLKSLDNRDLGL